jgi:hypothetical protein
MLRLLLLNLAVLVHDARAMRRGRRLPRLLCCQFQCTGLQQRSSAAAFTGTNSRFALSTEMISKRLRSARINRDALGLSLLRPPAALCGTNRVAEHQAVR